ncbi:hypothetical protein TNCV_4500651 [Trichonephila clavipes]|nr:hypothetical protein TNCV_4500651 [Trichonephila clavipes]
MYDERAGMHYISDRANDYGRAVLRMYYAQFLIAECRIIECFSNMRTYLNAAFRARWIVRGGSVPWPTPISRFDTSSSSSPDCFLWGHLQYLVYAIPLGSTPFGDSPS